VLKEREMDRRQRIEARLREGLTPLSLEVEDESHRHHGHSGWREGGQTHYRVALVSAAFAGRSRVERHRLVNGLLQSEFDGGLHALVLQLRAPGE
jgi:BolA protein